MERDVTVSRSLIIRTALFALPPLLAAVGGCSPPEPALAPVEVPAELQPAVDSSLTRLQSEARGLGIGGLGDLEARGVRVDEMALVHTRFQQRHHGVPVVGGEAIVHLREDGTALSTTSSLVGRIQVDTQPALSPDEAIAQAVRRDGCAGCLSAPAEVALWVLREGGRDHLAYRVQLHREDDVRPSMPLLYIDAHSGATLLAYDNLQTAQGTSLYSGTVSINTSKVGKTYYLEGLTRKIGTFDNRNTTSSTYRFTDTNNTWDSTSQKAAVDAHYGAEKTYDYFKNTHGRTGIDGAGGPGYYTAAASTATALISSRVHYGSQYNNAFWSGSYMTYGDGDGTTFSPLVTLDIAGHEMTHGVTQYEAGLVYSGESGALNESMSDVFGAMVERSVQGETANTWKIGEQCYTPSNGTGDALRYMDNPHAASNDGFTADDDPDHYSERYTGTGDNGGVHINSGIANKAFYLLAKGGTHHLGGTMTGIGADAAAKIWYRALSVYMTSSTGFAGARTATQTAAADLFGSGSAQHTAVAKAWSLCGVN